MSLLKQLQSITPFVDDEQLAKWQAALLANPSAEQQLALHVLLAWHLRQRNTVICAKHISEAKQLLASHHFAEPIYVMVQGRLELVRAEVSRLLADLPQAKAAIANAMTHLLTVDAPLALVDAYWVQAWILYDLGDTNKRDQALEQAITLASAAGDHERTQLATAGLARAAAFRDLTMAERAGATFLPTISGRRLRG